jgi:hypothetical protein
VQYEYNEKFSKYLELGSLVDETMDMIYGRGWPVIFSAWMCSKFSLKISVLTIRCITESFDEWFKLRKQQAQGGVKMLDEAGFFSLVNNSKGRHDWVAMPRFMFFSTVEEVRNCRVDPRETLRRFLSGYRG